jgi:TetR/AcrR family transcriptional repressor of lmrAB and yxaGH operons
MANGSRASMVRSAASLISSRGMSATSFSDVLGDSGAPRGSIYHHFPDGKRQLAEDAIRWTSERVLAYQRASTATTPSEVLERFIGMWRQVVLSSGGASGCVVAGVAIDTAAGSDPAVGDEGLTGVVRETFRSWVSLLAEQLEAVGIAPARAAPIALTTLASMEGALILCRSEGGTGPLDAVAAELHRLLADEVVATP